MSSLLLINQYFWPDVAATAQLLSDLAREAAREGWRVTALAGRGSYVAAKNPRLRGRDEWEGVRVVRVPCTSLGRASMVRRVTDYLTFFVAAALRVALGPRHDVVVCLSTPPMVAVLGLIAQMRGSRFAYKVEDLYPDVAFALGALDRRSPAAGLLRRVSALLLRRADVCVALDSAMGRALTERGAARVTVIPNWADGEAIRPEPGAGEGFRQRHGLDGHLVVLYSGNLGRAHTFDAVVAAARVLATEAPRVRFLFVGAGPRLAEVDSATDGLPNVSFLPYQPREELNELYNAADVHLVTLRDEVAGLLAPSKYPAALAAGKAVLLVGGRGSEMREEIAREEIGAAVVDSVEIIDFLRASSRDRESLEGLGERARSLFSKKYSLERASERWLGLLAGLAKPAAIR